MMLSQCHGFVIIDDVRGWQFGGEVDMALRDVGKKKHMGNNTILRKSRMPLTKIRDPTGFH